MAETYKVSVGFNAGNVGTAYNIFYFEWNAVGGPGDAAVLATAQQWINAIYAPLRNVMSNAFVGNGTRVDVVDDLGVVVRHVGAFNPTVSGNSAGDANSGPTAMSALARTAFPKVRGSKRFPGVIDTQVAGQLLTNTVVSALAAAVGQWLGLGGPLSFYRPGVLSTSRNGFIPFSSSGMVTNVPGTQTTRKPFRGA